MRRAVAHLENSNSAALALDPGLCKTSITLAAFCNLKAKGMAQTMLVVAPLRVCRQVWRQEGAKWSEFRHLKFGLLRGSKKEAVLKTPADVYLINPEGVPWLAKLFFGRSLPFDIVTIDELTKFKNHTSERSKALRPRLLRVARRWGLTGSLAPNGYMDIFGQQLMLDDGAALGRYITHYRDQYFQVGFNGFDYTLLPGAEKRIIAKIAPYWLQMSADDYMQLPPLVADLRELDMEPASRKLYETMKRDMIAALPEGVVTAANAAATYSKLAQMANGAVYVGDGLPGTARTASVIHETKLDALEELVEELNGEPLLLAYEFNHDLLRLQEWHQARYGKPLPYLGKGTTEKQETAYIAAWNRNELPVLAAHPASAGHGLNLQEGNAAHVCWFSPIWDLELYDQFLRRIRRSGNVATRIFNHILAVRGTIDELKLAALRDKDTTQVRLLRALNIEIRRIGAETHVDGDTPTDDRRIPMVAKLSRQNAAPAQVAPPAATNERPVPKGWGKPAGAADPDPAAEGQRERIQEQIAPKASPFSARVEAQREELSGSGHADGRLGDGVQPIAKAPAPRTRRSCTAAPEPTLALVSSECKVEILQIAFSDPNTTLDDGLEIAKNLLKWVEGDEA